MQVVVVVQAKVQALLDLAALVVAAQVLSEQPQQQTAPLIQAAVAAVRAIVVAQARALAAQVAPALSSSRFQTPLALNSPVA
jgi:hypothetical protein